MSRRSLPLTFRLLQFFPAFIVLVSTLRAAPERLLTGVDDDIRPFEMIISEGEIIRKIGSQPDVVDLDLSQFPHLTGRWGTLGLRQGSRDGVAWTSSAGRTDEMFVCFKPIREENFIRVRPGVVYLYEFEHIDRDCSVGPRIGFTRLSGTVNWTNQATPPPIFHSADPQQGWAILDWPPSPTWQKIQVRLSDVRGEGLLTTSLHWRLTTPTNTFIVRNLRSFLDYE